MPVVATTPWPVLSDINRSPAFHAALQKRGFDSTLLTYEATHGFVGYPPAFQTALNGGDPTHVQENCRAATVASCEFLRKWHAHERRTRVLDG